MIRVSPPLHLPILSAFLSLSRSRGRNGWQRGRVPREVWTLGNLHPKICYEGDLEDTHTLSRAWDIPEMLLYGKVICFRTCIIYPAILPSQVTLVKLLAESLECSRTTVLKVWSQKPTQVRLQGQNYFIIIPRGHLPL